MVEVVEVDAYVSDGTRCAPSVVPWVGIGAEVAGAPVIVEQLTRVAPAMYADSAQKQP